MMKKWLYHLLAARLPEWVRLRLERENQHLAARVLKLQQEIDRLNAYIDGMEEGLRMRPKIYLQTGGNE